MKISIIGLNILELAELQEVILILFMSFPKIAIMK